MKRFITILVLSVATAAIFTGCQKQENTMPETPSAPQTNDAPVAP